MKSVTQSPTNPNFVQNPNPFYDHARQHGALIHWEDYGLLSAFSYNAVAALFKDKRLGREIPAELARPPAPHTADFYKIESHSMLELEPPRHTRLRGLVLRAFTSRRIAELAPEIEQLCHELIDQFPNAPFDLIPTYANRIPVIIIARLLGVPESMSDQLLKWSNAMVAMYQASRTKEVEAQASQAAADFADFMRGYIDEKRQNPQDDLLTHLIAAEEDGEKLSTDELISTAILLLNAGHEATVHTIGNSVKTLIETGTKLDFLAPDKIDQTVEELIRFDPPLHMFTRYVYEDMEFSGHSLRRGDQVALMLAAANRDPEIWSDANSFDPSRPIKTNMAFGAGRHFCVGAPLARLEIKIALSVLFKRCPNLRLAEIPKYANVYHFHGLEKLMVSSS